MGNGQTKEFPVSTVYKREFLIMAEPPNLVNCLLADMRFSADAYKGTREVPTVAGKEDGHPK